MYKRIAKRIERLREEEELGITQEDKEVLGLNDTDSDESQSSGSDDEDTSENAADEDEVAGDDLDDAGNVDVLEDENSEEEEASLPDLIPPMSISTAAKAPLYVLPGKKKREGCIICPGKTLATKNAADLHTNSASHKRRLKRFQTYVEDAKSNSEDVESLDASIVVQKMDERFARPAPKPAPPPRKAKPTPTGPNRKMRRAALRMAKELEAGVAVGGQKDGVVDTKAAGAVTKEKAELPKSSGDPAGTKAAKATPVIAPSPTTAAAAPKEKARKRKKAAEPETETPAKRKRKSTAASS